MIFKMIFDLDTGIKLCRIKSQDVRFFYVIELRILYVLFTHFTGIPSFLWALLDMPRF